MVNPELRWRGVKEEREGGMRVKEGMEVYNVGEKDREGWNDTFIFSLLSLSYLQAHLSSLLTFVPPSWMVRAMEVKC